MPIIELKSRGVELDFPDSMSDQEIQDAIDKEYPRDGKDVAYELEQFRNAALTGGDLSNPFDQMSDDDYIKLRQYQDKEKKSWSDLFGIAKDTFSTIYDDVIQGTGSSIYNAATGKAGQVAESAKQGMIAGTIGISDLATKIVDPSKPIPTKEDFLKQTKDQPLETMADEAAPFFRKQVKNTEEDYLALVKNEKRKDSESFNRILAMESTLRGAPIEDVAAAFQYVDPTLLAGVASAGVKTLAKTLLKKGAQETAQASVEAAAREAAQRAAQQSAETIEGGGMREVVFNQAENLAQGVQSAASLPSKVMQAVKEGAEAIAPGTGAPAQAAAMTAAAMTDLGITASVLAGTKTIEKAAEVAGSIVRAAKQGASRAGLLERAALDPKISGSARAFANGLAQIQPLFGVGVRTAKQAAKGALAGAGVGAGLGYLADGEEGAAAGFGAGAAFGSMFGTLGSLWDVSKEAIGGSTARTRQNAAGDIGRFIAEKLPQEQAGWTSVFNNLAAKAGLEKAAHSMDALKIAEAAGAEVRLATPDEIAKWNNPGWTNHNEISGKQELVLNPKRILSDTAPHETAHIHFNAATNNLFKPEMFKAIVGSVDPVDGKVISEGLFNNEGLARIADDIAKAYGKANESQKNLFSNYADQLRNSLEPENLAKAREAIVDELTATYVGKAFNRSKAGRFNPDRLPLLYRRALDSIHEGFFNKLRATIYEKGNVLNMRDISKAFIDDKGRPIRIPELDAIFKKAFTNKLKAVDENTAPVDRIPVNLNDRAIWARSYGNMSGVLNPDNTVKSAAQIDREAVQRWQDMTARLSALPENQRLGLSFGRDDKGKTTMTAKGQISEEAINAILASNSIDQTAKSFLREVFTSIKDPQKTTLDTRYYGVYTRGKGTSKMVAGVKPASQNEILPYSIEFNSKDGIIVRAVDMTKVRDRLADALRKPDFKDAYKDYNQAMRAFRTYLDNLTLDKPVESSIILGGGELGNKRRNLFYDALDFRPAQGDEIRNNPLKLATGKSNPIKSYRIERFTRLSPTRDKFAFEEGTTYTRVKSNYQPDSFTPEALPNGEAWTNPDGYRILKKTGSKLYRVYDKDGTEVGVTSSHDAAIKKVKDSFLKSEKKAESNAFPPDETINPVLQKAIKKTNSDTDKHVLRTVYFKNQSKFEQAVADGRVRKSVPVESFVGKALMLHQPDTALAGSIEFNGNAIVEGTGGAYFPVLFGETGDFWASTESAAKGMAASLNQISDANGGKIAMGLTSAPVTKLFSSTNMSQGIVDTLEAVSRLPRQYGITTSKLNSIIVKASKVPSVKYIKGKKVESKLNVKIKISDPLEKNISIIREILKPDNSSFDNRLAFVEAIADETAKALKDKPRESSMFASLILGESNQYALGAIKKGKLSKAAILQAFGDMFSEEFLKSFQSVDKSGHLYAIIEMDGKVEAVPSTKHKSYPFVIRSTSGQKPVVNLLDKAMNWYDVVGIRNSDGFVPEDARLSVFPTSGVSSKKYGFLEVKSPNPEATPVLEITRFQPITPEQDAAYLNAVKSGDSEMAQRMVDEASMQPGETLLYNSIMSDVDPGDRFSDRVSIQRPGSRIAGFFLGTTKDAVKGYGDVIKTLGVKIQNPVILDMEGYTPQAFKNEIETKTGIVLKALQNAEIHNDSNFLEPVYAFLSPGMAGQVFDARKMARDLAARGFDAVQIWDDSAYGGPNQDVKQPSFWIPYPYSDRIRVIKQADPITYDNSGNVIPLSQRFNPSSNDIRFQPDENLVTVHNLTEPNLKHALKVGGLAVPSLAVVRTDLSNFDSFGDITLLAKPNLIDPQLNKSSKVFNADVYSPRYPNVKTVFKRSELDKVSPIFKGYYDELANVTGKGWSWSTDNLSYMLEDEGFNRIQYNRLAQYAYLRDAGLIEPPKQAIDSYEFDELLRKQTNELRDEVVNFVQSKLDNAGVKYEEKIPDGYTNSGTRRFLPHDLDTVVKIMTRKLKDGEGFNYGVGSIRAANAKPFKTLKAIKNDRDKIITSEKMETLKKEVDQEFMTLAESALNARKSKPSFGGLDAVSDDMKALVQGDNSWIREMYGDSPVVQDMKTFVAKLRDMPTEYFEAKVKRAVKLQEFEAAVVPMNTHEDVKAALRRNGLAVREYDPNNKDSRKTVIQSVSSEFNIRFQPDPSMPSVLNGSNGTRIIKSNSGKFRVYSGTGALLGIRDTQQAAEKLATKP